MTRVAVCVLALVLSACGGFPDGEWDTLTAPSAPLYCPTDDGACPPDDGVPSPVIVEVDGGASAHESIVMEPLTIVAQRRPERPEP